MVSTLHKWLNNIGYYRWGFFILLITIVMVNGLIVQHANFYILYIFAAIFLGIGYYNKPTWLLISATTLIVFCRFYLIPDTTSNIGTFLIHLFTYLLITFITVCLMKNIQKVKTDQLELVKSLSNALDSRDSYTKHHSENVAKYAVAIAKKMKLPKAECHTIEMGSLLHDIGKIGIPGKILLKPNFLTDEEYNHIKSHPAIGYDMLKHVTSFNENGVLDIIRYHHERYDGKGYPYGLKGEEIPLAARIVAVADTFDAMTSRRVYRHDLDLEYTLHEMRKNKGTQFDPEIVDVFLRLLKEEAGIVDADSRLSGMVL